MVDPAGVEPATSCLQGRCSPKIELWAHINFTWWERWVPTPLFPKETDLQSAAVADLLLSQKWMQEWDLNHTTFGL